MDQPTPMIQARKRAVGRVGSGIRLAADTIGCAGVGGATLGLNGSR